MQSPTIGQKSVTDAGFLRGRGKSKGGDVNILKWTFFPENCIKIKEIGSANGEGKVKKWRCQ